MNECLCLMEGMNAIQWMNVWNPVNTMHAENAALHWCNEWISVLNGVNEWNAVMHRFNEWMFEFNGGNDLNSVNECVESG